MVQTLIKGFQEFVKLNGRGKFSLVAGITNIQFQTELDLLFFYFADPYKISNINAVQCCWNFAQLTKIRNKQVAKIWGLKKQRFGDTMQFPEALENTSFKL